MPVANKIPGVVERPLPANKCREVDGLSSIQIALKMRNFGFVIRLGVILAAAIATWTAPPTGYLSLTKAETITSQINLQLLNKAVGGQALRADLKSTSLQLATLMIVPSPKLDWRSQRRSSQQELLELSLTELRGGKAALPPVYLNRFPANLTSLNSPQLRKDIFIKTVLPLVLRANAEVRLERAGVPGINTSEGQSYG